MSGRSCHGGVIRGTEIRIPDLAEAEAALAQHILTRPDHLAATRLDAPRVLRKAWEDFCDTKASLECAVEMARQAKRARTRTLYIPEKAEACNARPVRPLELVIHFPKRNNSMSQKKSAEELAELCRRNIALMEKEQPGSPEWARLRNIAYTHRARAKMRAEEEGIAFELPEIPVFAKASAPIPTPISQPAPPSRPPYSRGAETRESVPSLAAVSELLGEALVGEAAVTVDIRAIRSRIWHLIGNMEGLSLEARAALEPELGLLDAASHAAYGLAAGRIAVGS